MNFKVSILVPTYNGGPLWAEVLNGIDLQDLNIYRKIIIDSGSKDQTVELALKHNFEVISITSSEFNHGASRQRLVDATIESDICILLTQDAIPATVSSLSNLIKAFEDPEVGLAFGRQLPHLNAGLLETHARLFNYPDRSYFRTYADKQTLGFKVFFCSNSFAAYRVSSLKKVGGFPSNSIMGEDAIVSAKLLMEGFKLAYVAEATVRHSHTYPLLVEFRRYFDTRVFHEQNRWLIDQYGKPTGEGLRYVRSELKFILKNNPVLLLTVFGSLASKWFGYTIGGFYQKMPIALIKKLSLHKRFWDK